MVGERVAGIDLFESSALTGRLAGVTGLAAWWRGAFARVRGADEGMYLDIIADYIAAAERPWPQVQSACDAVQSRAAGASRGCTQ